MCVGVSVWLGWSDIRVAGFSLQHEYHSKPTTPKIQHTSNQEQYDQCGNSIELSQAPDDGYINVRNMLKLCFSLQHGYHSNPTTPKLKHTSNQEKYDQCGNSTE